MPRDVLGAAAKVFHEHGYATASIRDVANELGIRHASLYYYVESKEALLLQLLRAAEHDFERIIDEVDDDVGPLARLERFVRRRVEYNLASIERASVYYHERDRLGEALRPEERYVAELIAAAQAAGEADAGRDPSLLAANVLATIAAALRWPGPGEVADVCASFALGGVTAERH
jgi:AcrR family transcriptional regulator